jgi:hypothetical protein
MNNADFGNKGSKSGGDGGVHSVSALLQHGGPGSGRLRITGGNDSSGYSWHR